MTYLQTLPENAEHVRTTAWFDEGSVPAGLLRAHRVAEGVWGRLVVSEGHLTFRFEADAGPGLVVRAGDHVVIPPTEPHHLELDGPVRFCVEFHRPPDAEV